MPNRGRASQAEPTATQTGDETGPQQERSTSPRHLETLENPPNLPEIGVTPARRVKIFVQIDPLERCVLAVPVYCIYNLAEQSSKPSEGFLGGGLRPVWASTVDFGAPPRLGLIFQNRMRVGIEYDE